MRESSTRTTRVTRTDAEKVQAVSCFEKEKHLVVADLIFFVASVSLLGILRPDILMLTVYLLLYPYLIITKRKKAIRHLVVSSLLSLVWNIIANNQYGYNHEILTIYGLSSYPLFAWAVGLFSTYIVYSHLEQVIKPERFLKKILLFTALYLPAILLLETFAHHFFNIRNLATASYAGLPFCDCLHAPVWMQASYLALGPLYFIILYYVRAGGVKDKEASRQ